MSGTMRDYYNLLEMQKELTGIMRFFISKTGGGKFK